MSRIPKRSFSSVGSAPPGLKTVPESDSEATSPAASSGPAKRKNSLGYTLANIDTASNIPIPAAAAAKNPNLNLSHINRLIGYNQALNRQKNAAARPSYITQSDDLIDNEVQHQIAALRDLDGTLAALATKADDLEVDIVELKRNNKKLSHKIADVSNSIASSARKFEYVEDSVMKNVQNRERLVNISLEELANKLAVQLNEVKFQLNHEIEVAKQYKEDNQEELERLLEQKDKLQLVLAEAEAETGAKVQAESEALERDLVAKMQQKMAQSDKLMKIYEQKQAEFETVTRQLTELNSTVETTRIDVAAVERSISDIEASSNSFVSLKANLVSQIETLESTFNALNKESVPVDTQLRDAAARHEQIAQKVKKQVQIRQLLENSIMEYQDSVRTIVNCSDLKVEANRVSVDGRALSFSKCFTQLADPDFIEEYSFFALPSLLSKNSHVIFTGQHNLLVNSVLHIYTVLQQRGVSLRQKGWDFEFAFKGLEVGDTFHDLLDSKRNLGGFSSLRDVTSQTMLIDELSDLNVLHTIESDQPRIYIMMIECKNVELSKSQTNLVTFFDLNSMEPAEQSECIDTVVAKKPANLLGEVLLSIQQERCMYICQADGSCHSILTALSKL